MREIQRTIVSAVIFSRDGKLLMGKKDPRKGGVFSDCWHIPGGGVDEGETMIEALVREIKEETGLDISSYETEQIPSLSPRVAEKTLATGEVVLCHMNFNLFKVQLDKVAEEIKLDRTDDLVEMRWLSRKELNEIKHIPGGKEHFKKLGFI